MKTCFCLRLCETRLIVSKINFDGESAIVIVVSDSDDLTGTSFEAF